MIYLLRIARDWWAWRRLRVYYEIHCYGPCRAEYVTILYRGQHWCMKSPRFDRYGGNWAGWYVDWPN